MVQDNSLLNIALVKRNLGDQGVPITIKMAKIAAQ
jgi:hypothetical protein